MFEKREATFRGLIGVAFGALALFITITVLAPVVTTPIFIVFICLSLAHFSQSMIVFLDSLD